MPELPDVEMFLSYFKSTALHNKIENIEFTSTKILKDTSVSDFKKALEGESFSEASRYGKHLFAQTTGKYVLRMHFGMTGDLKYYKGDEEVQYSRLLLHFENGYNLAFISRRMLGKVSIEESIDDFVSKHKLGPDALDISAEDFRNMVSNSNQALKSMLMDQSKIAGIGNVYADEILFHSKLKPTKSSTNLDDKEIGNLYKQIGKVLRYAVDHDADPEKFAGSYFLPHRSKKGKCPKCGNSLKTERISGRSTYFCPDCQK